MWSRSSVLGAKTQPVISNQDQTCWSLTRLWVPEQAGTKDRAASMCFTVFMSHSFSRHVLPSADSGELPSSLLVFDAHFNNEPALQTSLRKGAKSRASRVTLPCWSGPAIFSFSSWPCSICRSMSKKQTWTFTSFLRTPQAGYWYLLTEGKSLLASEKWEGEWV